jgi:two-component system KDP operon response regulator KdpE
MNDAPISPGKILLVDDEANIREGLRVLLQKDGHEARTAATAEAALAELAHYRAEAVILDIQMPGMLGTELLALIKERWPHTAVILLTGQGSLATAMTAVKHNAFDYLLKPAQPDAIRELLARALAASRREREQAALLDNLRVGLQRLEGGTGGPPSAAGPLRLGDLTLDFVRREVRRQEEPLPLTPTEYKLLQTLAEANGAVLDYVALVRLVLAYEAELPEAKELIKRHIFTLRQKIEPDPARPSLILNARGVGYRAAL